MVKAWCGVMTAFLIIALICIGLILKPVEVTTSNTRLAPSALTVEGQILRVEAWKQYPEYNTGLGIIAIIAFASAIFACSMAYKENQSTTIEIQVGNSEKI